MNTLSNFASWADIFISALEGARAIQNFDLKELYYAVIVVGDVEHMNTYALNQDSIGIRSQLNPDYSILLRRWILIRIPLRYCAIL